MRHRRSHDRQSTHLRWRGASPRRFCEGCRRSWPTHHLYGTSGDRDAPPVDAAGILLLPSFVTNVWQMLAGRTLRIVFRRLWPMMFAVCASTWTGLGLMTGASAKFGTALLGVAPAIYAITGLGTLRLSAPRAWEPILSPVVGGITGLITAATGVFVVLAVPYLQAIGLEKEELVQALGYPSPSRRSHSRSMSALTAFRSRWGAPASCHWHRTVWVCGSGSPSSRICYRMRSEGGSSSAYCCLAYTWLHALLFDLSLTGTTSVRQVLQCSDKR